MILKEELLDIEIESSNKISPNFIFKNLIYAFNKINESADTNQKFLNLMRNSEIYYDTIKPSYYKDINIKLKNGIANGTIRISTHQVNPKIWVENDNYDYGISIVITDKDYEKTKNDNYDIKIYEYHFKNPSDDDIEEIGKYVSDVILNSKAWNVKKVNFKNSTLHEIGLKNVNETLYSSIINKISETLKNELGL